mmetsp:Transcript_15913/g.24567  ORF Transcript_15913/g.24567 Transcript_15913/m.24567 type:complete len:117 (-) Transcript_15913:1403-1753(-)
MVHSMMGVKPTTKDSQFSRKQTHQMDSRSAFEQQNQPEKGADSLNTSSLSRIKEDNESNISPKRRGSHINVQFQKLEINQESSRKMITKKKSTDLANSRAKQVEDSKSVSSFGDQN